MRQIQPTRAQMTTSAVDLYWIPLGAGVGGEVVRWSGRLYETLSAVTERRPRQPLFHSALIVGVESVDTVIEMAPVWTKRGERGVVAEGAVGARLLGRSRLFRYEVRCWRGGVIPDAAAASDGPVAVSDDARRAARILELAHELPTPVWGRDELGAGEMWNSNSIVAWLLARAEVDVHALHPPGNGRAPGWRAGLFAAGVIS